MFRMWFLVVSLVVLPAGSDLAAAQDRVEAEATLEVIRRVPISTEVAGRIISVTPSEEGVLVSAGDELIRLDDAVIQAEVERADLELRLQTEIEFAKKSLEVAIAEEQQKKEANARRPGAFNPSEIRQVQLEVEKSEASLRKANDDKLIQAADLKIKQAQLAQYTVRAPFDGVVTLIKVFPGQNVRPGEQVLELTDMSFLRARVKVSAKDRRKLFVGDKVELVIVEDEDVELGKRGDDSKTPRGGAAANRPGVDSLLNPAPAGTGNVQRADVAPANDVAVIAAPQEPPAADRVFIGEIRFIDPVIDNVSGSAVINLSAYVPNRVDRYGRYLLYQGMKVKATVLSQPRE